MSDGTTFEVGGSDAVRRLDEAAKREREERQLLLAAYGELSEGNRESLFRYVALLVAKNDFERDDEPDEVYIPPKAAPGKGDARCSFCGRGASQARRLIAGAKGAYICDDCVDVCAEIIQDEFGDEEGDA